MNQGIPIANPIRDERIEPKAARAEPSKKWNAAQRSTCRRLTRKRLAKNSATGARQAHTYARLSQHSSRGSHRDGSLEWKACTRSWLKKNRPPRVQQTAAFANPI